METKGLPNFSNAVLSIMGKITKEIISDDDLKKMIGALTDFDDFATDCYCIKESTEARKGGRNLILKIVWHFG